MVNSKYDTCFLYYCGGRELSLTSRAKNLDVSCFFFYCYYYSTPSLTKDCKSNSLVTFNNLSRACSWCGYDGHFPLERTANMYECYSGLYFIIQPRCHTNVVCECSVYHNVRMSLARPLASKLINFEQPCTLIFSSSFPTSCRAWSSLHLWPWVRYVARRNLCVLEERKIMLSCSIVRSFCLNCPLCNNLRGQGFCVVVYDQRTFLLAALRLSEASDFLGFLKFFPLSPDCPHLSLNLLFSQTQKSVSLLDETHWTSDSCTQNLRACRLNQTQLNSLLLFTNYHKVCPRSLDATGLLVTLYSISGISPFSPNWINLFTLLYSLKALSCRTVWIPLDSLYKKLLK